MATSTQARAAQRPAPVLWDVMVEHFDEAAFFFDQWRRASRSPRHVISQVRDGFEARIDRHIVAMLLSGETALERLLTPALEEPTSPERATIAALALLRTSKRRHVYALLDVLFFSRDEAQRRAIVGAFALDGDPRIEVFVREAFAKARSPREKAALLEVFAALRLDPGDTLADCLDTGFAALDGAALEVAGRCRRVELLKAVEGALESDDLRLQRAAIEAGLLLGSVKAWRACLHQVETDGALREWAMLPAAMLGGARELDILHEHLEDAATRPAALWALGFSGSFASAERCIRHLESEDLRTAKLAAEAFGAITGLCRLTLELFAFKDEPELSAQPEEGLLPLEQDDLDADLVPDGTDELLHLDPQDVISWFERRRDELSRPARLFAGSPYHPFELVNALATIPMRRRPGLAFELALRTGGRRWVSTEAFTTRQIRDLQALEDLEASELVERLGEV